MNRPITIKVLRGGDEAVLTRVAPQLFDYAIDAARTTEFLDDPRHHLAVAIDDDVVVGFVSAVHYVHPDQPPQLWINEVAVVPSHQRQGLATAMMSALFAVGRDLGCSEAWVLTDRPNIPAMSLYESLGGLGTDHVMFSFPLI